MNPFLPIAVLGLLGALALGSKKTKAAPGGTAPLGQAEPVYVRTILALLNSDTQEVGKLVNEFRGRGDTATAGALEAEQGRMQAAAVGQGASLPQVLTQALDGPKSPALNEWCGTLLSLEGRPTVLSQWASAFNAANMPNTAAALQGKAVNLSGTGVAPVPPVASNPPASFPVPGSPGVPPVSVPGQLSASVQQQVANVLSGGNAAAMRALAAQLEAQGFPVPAEQLRARALEIERTTAQSPGLPPVTPQPVSLPGITPELQAQIDRAQGSPVLLRQMADFLDSMGFRAEANQLRNQAVAIERAGSLPTTPSTLPTTTVPPLVIVSNPRRELAQDTVIDLNGNPKSGVVGKPNSMLKLFQEQEGLVIDGLYGPKSGLAVATYGIIPPKPRQYNTKNMAKDKATYKAAMLEYAQSDPARRVQWIEAGNV